MAPQPGPPSGYYAVRTCCPLRAVWHHASLLLRAIRILQHSCQRAYRGPRASQSGEGARRFPSGSRSWDRCQLLSPALPATSYVTHARVSIADEKANAVPRLPRYAFTCKRTTNRLRDNDHRSVGHYVACQTCTVLSLLAEAIRVPSGDQATAVVQAAFS